MYRLEEEEDYLENGGRGWRCRGEVFWETCLIKTIDLYMGEYIIC